MPRVGKGRCRPLPWLLVLAIAGCASYHPAPLNLAAQLKPSIAALDHAGLQIPANGALSLRDVAELAVLNNPDLVAARAQRGIAQADLLAAGLPPDPSISGGFEALLGGPGDVSAISGSLMQDVSALITYKADKQAAQAGLSQVDAGILWQEWQVASQAEQLCVTLDGDARMIASLRANAAGLNAVNQSTAKQVAAHNLTLNEASTSMAALATVQTALNTAEQGLSHDRDQLDALLGLEPGTEIPLAPPQVQTVSAAQAKQALDTLAQRRPDLIALSYGYTQADAKLRGAILSQFLPVSIGAAGGRDTTNVMSAGPQVTLTLPLFNRNRAGIASARATRAALGAQFRASLAAADGGARALLADAALLRAQSAAADAQARGASVIAVQARHAYATGMLDALSAANLQTAAGERGREAIALNTQARIAEISLATLLGLGLPPIATPEPAP